MLSPAYVAGFVDGEGSIFIAKNRGGRGYCLAVNVGQTDRRPLDIMCEQFGGSIQSAKRYQRKAMHYWTVYAANAQQLIETIRSYLIVKAEQAWLALEFQAVCKNKKRHLLSPEEKALREGYYLALQMAKHLDDDETLASEG